MKYIDSKQWQLFLDKFSEKNQIDISVANSNLNKGIKFELVVQKLLNIIFSKQITFSPTQTSYDGSKDFWGIDYKNDIWWAECKNYTTNISLTQLAPTHIMAEINNVDHLLFFSFTELNTNLKKRIGQYSNKYQKEIFLYDDEALEILLLSNMKKDFEDFCIFDKTKCSTLASNLEAIFFEEISTDSVSQNNFSGYYTISELHVGNIYVLNALIINRHPKKTQTASIEICKTGECDDFCFEFLYDKEKILEIEIKPNQIILERIHVKVIKYQPLLKLPQLKVCSIDNKSAPILKSTSKNYKCHWTRKTVLIGRNYQFILETFRDSYINNSKNVNGLLVYGAGGTGKTRILEECTGYIIKSQYRILNFTGFDHNSWQDVIREIVFELFEISTDIRLNILANIDDFILNTEPNSLVNNNILDMLKILQNITSITEIKPYFNLIFEKISRQKYALIIDNMQSYNADIISFFKSMIQYFCNLQGSNSLLLLFSINTSLLTDKAYLDFIGDLELNTGYGHNFISRKISGFESENNSIAFLKTILQLDDYPVNFIYLRSILQKTSHNPKYIELMADYLIYKNCVEFQSHNTVCNHLACCAIYHAKLYFIHLSAKVHIAFHFICHVKGFALNIIRKRGIHCYFCWCNFASGVDEIGMIAAICPDRKRSNTVMERGILAKINDC